MNQVGSVSLVAALAFAAYAVVAGAVGGKLRSARITRSAERATLGFFLMITLAVVAIEYMIFHNDFHNAYVAEHSNRDLLPFYKFAALWSGQEGSLLFWTWLLSIYSALVVWQNRRKNRQLMPYVVSVLMGVGTFFSLLVFFVANPFQELSLVSSTGSPRFCAARWQRPEPASAIPLDGDPSSHALSGICGHGGAVCVRHGGADYAPTGR